MYDGRGNEDLDVSVISTATGLFELSFILHQLDSRRQGKSTGQVQVVGSEGKPVLQAPSQDVGQVPVSIDIDNTFLIFCTAS